MPYNEDLARRVRDILASCEDVTEKSMFGGIAFMIHGHMCAGVVRDDLMVRVGGEAYDRLVKRPHARPMDFTGKPMRGFLYVSGPPLESHAALRKWVQHGIDLAESFPARSEEMKTEASLKSARGTVSKKKKT